MDKATKHEEPIIWIIEIKTTFGWFPHIHPRYIVLSEAQTQLDDWGKEWPHESYRISTYRRVKKV